MRVTNNLSYQMQIKNMNDNVEKLYQYFVKAGTGKSFQKPSDNPTEAVESISITSTMKSMEYYTDTAESAYEWMSATEFSLQQITDSASRAKVLVSRGVNESLGEDERRVIATELDGILEQVVSSANYQHRDRYVFAGFATKTMPFERNTSGAVETVDYLPGTGTFEAIKRDIAPGESITVNIDGESTFGALFNSIIAARDALNDNNTAALEAAFGDLQDASDTVANQLTTIGARLRTADTTLEKNQESKLELEALISKKADANMAEAISQLANQQVVYQAVLEVGAKANTLMNLFNVL